MGAKDADTITATVKSEKRPIQSNAGFDEKGGKEAGALKYIIKNPKKYDIANNGTKFTKLGRGFEVIRLLPNGEPISQKTEVKFRLSNIEHSTAFRVLIGIGSMDGQTRTQIASKNPLSYQIALAEQTRWRIAGEWDLNCSFDNTFHPCDQCEFVTVIYDPANFELKITDHQKYKEVHKVEESDRYCFWANICQKDAEIEVVHVKTF